MHPKQHRKEAFHKPKLFLVYEDVSLLLVQFEVKKSKKLTRKY